MKPSTKLDRFFDWSLFILSAVCGTLTWVQRDRLDFGEEIAYLAWGCTLLWAMHLIADHYRADGGDH